MDTSPRQEFVNIAGDLAETFSFNRSIGQIYGFLYLAPAPVSLDDIAKELRMSKGNASINLRTLADWGAVRSVSMSGSRRDFYEANRNVKELALRRLQEGLSRRLDFAEENLEKVAAQWRDAPGKDGEVFSKKRVEELKSLVTNGRRLLKALPKVLAFLPR